MVLRDGKELTIRDPLGPLATKRRPKSVFRIKSGFEHSLLQKEVKHHNVKTVNNWAITGLVVHYWYDNFQLYHLHFNLLFQTFTFL